ncbi:hypothetical protein [Hydrotalea sandarakina]|uniref:hypothetical protein n=1 Tax=Hydrotalea sandarakina TaxID=1004304 RepID=UPI0011B65DB3|nr:hypothetical protein [Hydrotalea sandarakina]
MEGKFTFRASQKRQENVFTGAWYTHAQQPHSFRSGECPSNQSFPWWRVSPPAMFPGFCLISVDTTAPFVCFFIQSTYRPIGLEIPSGRLLSLAGIFLSHAAAAQQPSTLCYAL